MSSTPKPSSSSSSSSPSPSTTIAVPQAVVDKGKQIWNFLYDKDCPFGSFYIWFIALLSLYYMFWLPEITLKVDEGGKDIKPVTINKTLRGILFLATIGSGVAGYFLIIKPGCRSVGPIWAFLWFIVAMVMTGVITQFVLMASRQTNLTGAADLLKQVNTLG